MHVSASPLVIYLFTNEEDLMHTCESVLQSNWAALIFE